MASPKASKFLSMFETIRAELDEHHDRKERIVKASRDITAASKKIIFSLQRVRNLSEALPKAIVDECAPRYASIQQLYQSIQPDLQGINAYRYASIITHGNQEYMEAALFRGYLETQALIGPDKVQESLQDKVELTTSEYLLGIYDMTGELMKLAVTMMASASAADEKRTKVLSDLRDLRIHLENLNIPRSLKLGQEVSQKGGVMQASVEKVERAFYGKIVRGAERPDGWSPDERAPAMIEVE